MTTTRQRLDLLARAFPRLFPRPELRRLLRSQLGHVDALERWIDQNGQRVRARAPKLIYHVCAGNLAISAQTSLAHGLLLGARNVIKLPSAREDSSVRREITAFVHALPAPLRRLVRLESKFKLAPFSQADVIVAFGSDATLEKLRRQLRAGQRFIGHGHALSLLWIEEPARLSSRQARACATDILTYDQMGCLSPQAIYVPPRADLAGLAAKLTRALEAEWRRLPKKPARPLAVAARIEEARDIARALGQQLWLPPTSHLGWTLIHDPGPDFQTSPLHGVVYLRSGNEQRIGRELASVSGRISTVGVAGKTSSRWEKLFLNLGVSRFCAAGRMQFPPLTWQHDGRPVLADLVTWAGAEPGA
jgi:hypothetical protein